MRTSKTGFVRPGAGGPVWQNVTVGAGGAVTGAVCNPTRPGLAHLRTDIGGLYRWNGPGGNSTGTDPFHRGVQTIDVADGNR